MSARSTDLMAVNDLLSPFLGAGFYYKTFMWPRAFWEGLYEPLIRRAAGLGRMTKGASPELSERAFAHCDVLVIGGGSCGPHRRADGGRGRRGRDPDRRKYRARRAAPVR
jgi:NADPH-dependent 2,4-dienoyl-CoA reductase/sulfur reductase-like enzyme